MLKYLLVYSLLSLTKNVDIVFGNVSGTSTPIMDPIGITGNKTDLGTSYTVGVFTLGGTDGVPVSVSYDASVALADGAAGDDIIFTPDVAGHITAANQVDAAGVASESSVTLGPAGYTIWVGGNLGTLSNQAVGDYTATLGAGLFTITVEYF